MLGGSISLEIGDCFFRSDLWVRGGKGADMVDLSSSGGNAVEVHGKIR